MFKMCIDIGGTFTDFVLIDPESGEIHTTKVLTTPHQPDQAVVDGARQLLQAAQMDPGEVGSVIHATTLVTNALIERKGVQTALLTTRGFRDLLEIGTERSYDIYDIQLDMPDPLVPRFLRQEVDERVLSDGSVLLPLDVEQARQVLHELRDRYQIESIAVSFLYSFLHPEHEQQAAGLIREELPGVSISLSSQVLPEIREYPRTSTTVANAYVQPIVSRYMERLSRRLADEGLPEHFHVMLSDGGLTSAKTAAEFPVRIVESGPAAGALAACSFGQLAGVENLLAFDMGGTTAKASIILGGRPTRTTDFEAARLRWEKKGSGLPLRVPVIDLIEVGAGGGSLASINALDLLQVGPGSAGADPGPVCYRRCGQIPTVTDADLILGYLDPDYFLGGAMKLDRPAAEEAIRAQVAGPLGLSLEKAALGIHEVVNEQMARAANIHLIEHGLDGRDFTLIAFGGAGPVHAFGLAQRLNIQEIIYPPLAGVASSAGIAWAPASFSLVRSLPFRLSQVDLARVQGLYADMEAEALKVMGEAGVEASQVTFQRACDARYRGQGYEIEVGLPGGKIDARLLEALEANFIEAYQKLYHRAVPDVELEVLAWRLVADGPRVQIRPPQSQGGRGEPLKGYRPALFPGQETFISTPVYDRYALAPGSAFEGPAIVEERESTAIIGVGAQARIDPAGNLRVQVRAKTGVEVLNREVVGSWPK